MSFAYLPLYTGDYLRDTQHLSCSEHGIYLKLLMHCWDQKGPAPLDERKLCGIVNARSSDEVEAMRRVLGEFFVRMEDGHYNLRMQREVARCESISTKREDAGRRGANERMRRFRESEASAKQLPSNCQASVKQVTLSPSPSPSLSPEVEKNTPTVCVPIVSDGDEKPAGSAKLPQCPTAKLVDLYHERCPTMPRVAILSDQRKRLISSRWRDVAAEYRNEQDTAGEALAWFASFFSDVGRSAFLTGKSGSWRADLEWLMKPANFTKTAEGRYREQKA